jgi:tripartite ATP-independent transporter DctP family solute receptor
MKSFAGRIFAAALATIAAVGLTVAAKAADFTLVVSHGSQADSTNGRMFENFKKLVEERSGGRVAVQVLCCSQWAQANESEIEGLQRGELAIANPPAAAFGGFVPAMALLDIPFVLQGITQSDKVLNEGAAMKMLATQLVAAGVHPMGYVVLGMQNTTTNGKFGAEITSPDQVKGMKIRTLTSANHLAIWQALGAIPTPMPFGELFTAMEQGVVDAEYNGTSIIHDNRFFEVQKTLTTTAFLPLVGVFSISEKVYQSLPEDLRKIVTDAGLESVRQWNGLYAAQEEEQLADLRKSGMTVTELTGEQRAVWADRVKDVAEKIKTSVGDAALVDAFDADIAAAK